MGYGSSIEVGPRLSSRVTESFKEFMSTTRRRCPKSLLPHSLPDTMYTVQTFSKEPINKSWKSEDTQAYVSNNKCLLLKVMEILRWGKMKDDNGAMYGCGLVPF